ncbi:hypothetical protein D1007_37133 [Hordeum vulgare]|nr:hypothetical protein D1007_37133 [Hordeum vulgare]
MIASSTSFTLPLNQLVISIKAATNGFKFVGQLSEVWVLVEDVPAELILVPFLIAFGVLLGNPIEVDGESLTRLGQVRLRIWCVDMVCLHGSVDVFPSADGIRLRVRLKGVEPSRLLRLPLIPLPPLRRNMTMTLLVNDPKDDVQHVPDTATNEKTSPMGTPILGVCSNMSVRPLSPPMSGIEDLASSPARVVMALVRKKKKSIIRKFSAKSRAVSGSKTLVSGLCRCLEDDLGDASSSPSRAASLSPSSLSPSIRTPTSTARKGRRGRDSGESVAARAERRAAGRDLQPSGFLNILAMKISGLLSSSQRSFGPMDDWHKCSYGLRKFLHGWSRNRAAEARRWKGSLEARIASLDVHADGQGLSHGEWGSRYSLEEALMFLHR